MNGVTVAICCYNSSARIAETLRHLSLQRLSENIPWEVLIIDNACTDDTVEVAHPSRDFWTITDPKSGRRVESRREPDLGP